MVVGGFGLCTKLRTPGMFSQSLMEASEGFFDVQLLGCVDLLVNVVLRLEVDCLEGGLQRVRSSNVC